MVNGRKRSGWLENADLEEFGTLKEAIKYCGENPNCKYIDNYRCAGDSGYHVYNHTLSLDTTRDNIGDDGSCAWVRTIRFPFLDTIKNQTLF